MGCLLCLRHCARSSQRPGLVILVTILMTFFMLASDATSRAEEQHIAIKLWFGQPCSTLWSLLEVSKAVTILKCVG